MKTTMIAGLVSLVLIGCAAAPKPELPEMKYNQAALLWWGIHSCLSTDGISPDIAVKAKQFYASGLMGYTVNYDLLDSKVYELNSHTPATKQDCNAIAMYAIEHSNQVEAHNRQAVAEQQATQATIQQNKITNTCCNRIGSQILCNSY